MVGKAADCPYLTVRIQSGMSVHLREDVPKSTHASAAELNCSLLVCTDFTSDLAWQQVSEDAQATYDEGFHDYLEPVSDAAFDRAAWKAVRAAVPANDQGAAVLLIADSVTVTSKDYPILVVDLLDAEGKPPFRCIPAELWAVENNLNITNLDWKTLQKRSMKMAPTVAYAGRPSAIFYYAM